MYIDEGILKAGRCPQFPGLKVRHRQRHRRSRTGSRTGLQCRTATRDYQYSFDQCLWGILEGLRLDRLVCCWDGSRAATRAINDALPLLVKAAAVDLLIVLNEKTRGAENEIRGDEISRHLARHDVRVQIEKTTAEDIDVGNAILSYVADRSASLIVMGGYGHSRLRELILGGVTRDMLNSMTVPVFMSH